MNKQKKILILGGLGFIGKNLYNSLGGENHHVTILTDCITEEDDRFLAPGAGKNIVTGSILDQDFMEDVVRGYDVVFSLAGNSGASDSIKDPRHDLDTNLNGHLNILEACRKNNPQALLIFPSSRLVYGKPLKNPVNESHALNPESIYAIHKLTAEHYYLLYQRLYGLKCVIFRISNPFGPYQKFGSNHYGILNWFIHKAIHQKEIEIYGDGGQRRDFIHIEDVVDLFKRAMDNKVMFGKTYNVGYSQGMSVKVAAETIAKYIPGTKITYKPWPEIDKKIETGDYISDIDLVRRDTGWQPRINFDQGIKKTIEFYDRRSA